MAKNEKDEFATAFNDGEQGEEGTHVDDDNPSATDETPAEDGAAADPAAEPSAEETVQVEDGVPETLQSEPAEVPGNVDENQTSMPENDDQANSADDPETYLANDFGDDFVVALRQFIINTVRAEGLGDVSGLDARVTQLISDMEQKDWANHFAAIKRQHADFKEIIESPEFANWVASLDTSEQQDVERIKQNGSADEIIDLLTRFKNRITDEFDDSQYSDAEGIRSGGVRIPDIIASKDDYAKAWESA